MVLRTSAVIIVAISILMMAGMSCSSGNSPVIPPGLSINQESENPKSEAAGNQYNMGYSLIQIDTENPDVEIIPVRTADLHLNITGIMNSTMGVSAQIIPGESDIPNGLVAVDIALTHPFGTLPQFSGFDVTGILMTPGTLSIGSLVFADPAKSETQLENADGFTRWWNPAEFTTPGMFGYIDGNLAASPASALTATINPYKLFADVLGPSDSLSFVSAEPMDSPDGRAVFKAGSANTRRYMIRFPLDPGPKISYGYAIGCSWNSPDVKPPADIPNDFPIEANQPEAYRVVVAATINTLYWDSQGDVGGGQLELQINVHDWQGQFSGDTKAEVSAVRIFSAGLFSGGVDGIFLNQEPGKARYTANLTGTAIPKAPGKVLIAIRVGSEGGPNYNQVGADAPDGSVSAWQTLVVDIPELTCTGDANTDWLEAEDVEFGNAINDSVCLPDDFKDFYLFNFPPGHKLTGNIDLHCQTTETKLGLYTISQNLLAEANVTDGVASIDVGSMGLTPGNYYLRVLTSNDTQISVYELEMAAELENITPTSPAVEVTPKDLAVDPSKMWLEGDTLHMAGSYYWAYDVTNPVNPEFMHKPDEYWSGDDYADGLIYDMQFLDFDDHQINIHDVSDPLNPVFHEDILHTSMYQAGMDVAGHYLFLKGQQTPDATIEIYDRTTDLLAPTLLNSITVPYYAQICDMLDPDGNETRLVVAGLKVIHVFDIEDIDNIQPAGDYVFPSGQIRYMEVYDGNIYVLWDETGMSDVDLYVLHHSFDTLVKYDDADLPGNGYQISFNGSYAYVADGLTGVTPVDITNPWAVVVKDPVPTVSFCEWTLPDGDYLYAIPRDQGMQVFDISVPGAPEKVYRMPVSNKPEDSVKEGNYLYAADDNNLYHGLKLIDVTVPESARVVDEYPLDNWVNSIAIDNHRLAVAIQEDQIILFDVSIPGEFSYVGLLSTITPIYRVKIYNDILFAQVADNKFKTYEISDFSNPIYQGTVTLPDFARDFEINQDNLYAMIDNKILVYDVTNPSAMVYVDEFTFGGFFENSVLQDNLLYLSTGTSIYIIDVSNPILPELVSSTFVDDPDIFKLRYIQVDGQFVYIKSEYEHAWIVNAWPPEDPTVIGQISQEPVGSARYMSAEDGYYYEYTNSGVKIFDLY